MARFCTKCGAKLDNSKKFCTKCGAPLGNKNIDTDSKSQNTKFNNKTGTQSNNASPRLDKNKVGIKSSATNSIVPKVLAGIVALSLVTGAYFMFKGDLLPKSFGDKKVASSNSKSKNSKIAVSNAPMDISKYDKTKTGPVFTKEMEDILNYRRSDQQPLTYLSVSDLPDINFYKQPGSLDNSNFIGKVPYISNVWVSDKKIIDGREWYLAENIDGGTRENQDKYPLRGWFVKEPNLKIKFSDQVYYKLNFIKEIPLAFPEMKKEGNWRFVYSSDDMDYAAFIDRDSIKQEGDIIKFKVLEQSKGMSIYIEKEDLEHLVAICIDEYEYDTKNQVVEFKTGKFYNSNFKFLKDHTPFHKDPDNMIFRKYSGDGFYYRVPKNKPVKMVKPQFKETALFYMLEGK